MIDLKGQLGKYKIVKKLGSGGFGTVYLAEDTFLKTYRALKIPHRRGPMAEKSLQECILQSRLLDHPHIVKLLTVDIIDQNVVMVMEFVKGIDLETLLDKKDKLEIATALKYFKQLLSALDFAHKHKVIHRDIRPSNIMITEEDDIKVTDFGTSTLLDQKQYATTKIGSPPYMAPEQFEGRAVLASDIYSAGCLFYEMVSGLPPIVLANPMEIYKKAKASDFTPLKKKVPSIPDDLDRIITRALASDLETRYKSAADLLDDVLQLGKEKRTAGNSLEIKNIKERIDARHKRTDYICWNCNKVMPRQMKRCLYCGVEQ
jgi:serine/threonine protein kinase